MGEYEIVHTMTDYYDGPRGGIADFNGRPHVYESQFDESKENWTDTFLLMPIDEDLFELAMQDWAIWRRWETAFHKGESTLETHPALPKDRQRHDELKPLLEQRLKVDASRSIRAEGEFRTREDPSWSGHGWRPLEVKWTLIEGRSESDR